MFVGELHTSNAVSSSFIQSGFVNVCMPSDLDRQAGLGRYAGTQPLLAALLVCH